MIRYLIVFTFALFDFNIAMADEFGSRFTGKAPSALSSPSLEQQLQEISPAAGGEQEEDVDALPSEELNDQDVELEVEPEKEPAKSENSN